ncbi:hypothetical protein [Tumebacillus permanentifrigoris]|uniref:Uncharacterized protein n=1 Tax=Tumebacillus permanentifrigoris TaxID=378543 RepID=A0A316DCT7_9BACL|nr:hypothetical protein [Tumebacillus permanentifrigoris]PWK14323.1 hypothetical protein C7459_10577 [Tumebacillus permanentifrigoris]
MKPFNGVTHKDGGDQDMIAFDNPDDGDALEGIPQAAQGYEEKLVVVDNPDDFDDEGEDL